MIELKNVNKVYELKGSKVTALNQINLKIEDGEFVAITGSSGSGKSTLLNIIGLLDDVSDGQYDLGGNSIKYLSDDEMARLRNRMFGFVFQTFNLLPQRNALENVSLPLYYGKIPFEQRMIKAQDYLSTLGLADRVHHLPDELSGGQKQRVAIARALIMEPNVILADEPTGALDSRTSNEIMELLVNINKSGKTLIVVTHEAHVAAMASRKVILADGKIISDQRISG